MDKMLVTQALDERELLVKKIRNKIQKASFVDTIKHNEEKVYEAKITKEEYEKQAASSYQQIQDLIDRFQKLDAAIVVSNASNFIETSYGTYTVAGAIALRNRLRNKGPFKDEGDFENYICQKMRIEYAARIDLMEANNKKLQATAENMRLSILGKETKVKEDKPLEIVETYIRENTTELVDPLHIKKKIEELMEKKETLLQELDTKIKVSNATTFVEF